MNLFKKQKQTHRLQKQTYGYQRGRVGGEGGIGKWNMEWMINRDLLYSTGKSTQCSVITYMEKAMCISMDESV